MTNPWPTLGSVADFLAKIGCIAAYFVGWWWLYGVTNHREESASIAFVRPIDVTPGILQPWTASIYLVGGLLLPLAPFAFHWSWPGLRFVLFSYAVTSLIAFVCYVIWPIRIARPGFEGSDFGSWLMRQVVAVDGEANCNPSSHVYFAVLAALLILDARPGPEIVVAAVIVAVAVSLTTVTTGQHYWIDIPGGIVAACAGYGIGMFFRPWIAHESP